MGTHTQFMLNAQRWHQAPKKDPFLSQSINSLSAFTCAYSRTSLQSLVIFAICGLMLCVETGFALLPPLEQEIVEIKAILSDDKLREAIGSGEFIQSIRKTDDGYVIHTALKDLHVEVSYLPAKRPGPAQFELHFKH